MSRGIIRSLAICAALYVAVSLVVVGMQNYTQLNEDAPLAAAFEAVGRPFFADLITLGGLAGLTTVMVIIMLGQSRVAFAMSRDGLLPRWLAHVHPTFHTPYHITIIMCVVVAILAGFIPLAELAELVNIGTLFAFALVSIGGVILRRTQPDLPRTFRVPGMPIVPILAMLACGALMFFLTVETWLRFLVWMALGFIVYFRQPAAAYAGPQRRRQPTHAYHPVGTRARVAAGWGGVVVRPAVGPLREAVLHSGCGR